MKKYQAVLMTHNGDVLVEEFEDRRETVEFIENDWMGVKEGKNLWLNDIGQMFIERR